MTTQIDRLNSEFANTKENVERTLSNPNVSNEDKWELLTKLDKGLLPSEVYAISLPELDKNDIEFYDDFNFERYETIDVIEEIYERVIEEQEGGTAKFSEVDLEQLKKEIIESGVRTFINDW
jgi:hypothetical protein